MAMYGMAPLAGLDGGGFMADLLLVPYANAMLVPVPDTVDPVAIASLSDNIPDGWRAVGPLQRGTGRTRPRGPPCSRRRPSVDRVLRRRVCIRLGAQVDYVDTDVQRLAMAEKLGATVHDRQARQVVGPVPGHRAHHTDPAVLAATMRATWPDGVCTDTGVYYQGAVEMPLLSMYTRGLRFVTGRVNARAVIPEILELITAHCDLAPAVDRVVAWEDAPHAWPSMTGKTVFTRS